MTPLPFLMSGVFFFFLFPFPNHAHVQPSVSTKTKDVADERAEGEDVWGKGIAVLLGGSKQKQKQNRAPPVEEGREAFRPHKMGLVADAMTRHILVKPLAIGGDKLWNLRHVGEGPCPSCKFRRKECVYFVPVTAMLSNIYCLLSLSLSPSYIND